MGQRGQPATMLRLDSAGAYSIGIKLGRRSIDALLIDFTGTVLKSRRFERLDPEPPEALQLALRCIKELRGALAPSRRDRLMGIGLALPDTTHPNLSMDELRPGMQQVWQAFDLAGKLRTMVDVPVLHESNGTAVALAELFCGHGRELDDFLCIYVNSSICAGLVLDGDYRKGANGHAGSMQAIPVQPGRWALRSGGEAADPVRLFQRASGSALIRHLRDNGIDVVRAADLHAVMRNYEPLVSEWLQDCADALLVPMLTMASLLDLQAVILDGNMPRLLIEALVKRLLPLLDAAAAGVPQPVVLRLGSVGDQAAALGSAFLPLHSRHR